MRQRRQDRINIIKQYTQQKYKYMKPQKLTKQRRQQLQGLPAIQNNGFNQTIIINNPNFNINYIDHPGLGTQNNKPNSRQNNIQQLPLYDNKNSSKGIDAWSLNKNLKEFSQTRQLGFFKGNGSKTKSNADLQHSPYLNHKTKTQQIKPYNKIKPSAVIQPTSFRQNRTIGTIRHDSTIASGRQHSTLSNHQNSTVDAYDDSKPAFRKRKFESKPRPKLNFHDKSASQLEIADRQCNDLKETINNGSKTQRRITPLALKTRRNRFMEIQTDRETNKKSGQNQEQVDVQDLQNSLLIGQSPKKLISTQQISQKMPSSRRKFQKSMQKISKCFLSKVDNYFDENRNSQLPSSKIELYATTVQQPVSYSYNIDYKSSPLDYVQTSYDFQFDEQKPKNRPKTPYKRKKMYEQIK